MADNSDGRVHSSERRSQEPTRAQIGVPASFHSPSSYSVLSLLNLVRRRWLLITLVLAITTIAIGAFGFVLPARYTAEAFIRIDPSNKSILDLSAAYGKPPDAAFVETEINEIVSRPVAEAVVKRLDLAHSKEFGYHASFLSHFSRPAVAPTETEIFDGSVDATLRNLQVSREGTSYRVAVRFSSHSAALAAQVANSFVEEYLNRSRGLQSNAASDQAMMLNEQLQHLAESVRSADDELAKFRASTGLARSSGSGTGTVNDQQISSISAQIAVADAAADDAVSHAEGAKRQTAAKGAENVAEVIASPVIIELRKKRAETVQEQAQILHDYGPLHPDAVRNSQQLNDLDKQIDQEAQRIISGLESSARTATSTARSLREQLQTLKSEQSSNLISTVRADSLERDAQAKRSTYERMAQAAQQIGQDVIVPTGRISSLAPEPHMPSFPKKPLLIEVGVLLGIVLGLSSAFAVDALDNTVRQPHFFADSLGISFLGMVPALSTDEVKDAGASVAWDYMTQRPRSVYVEALRGIRAGLLTSHRTDTGQIICVTSALPHEGKSTLALTLARLMAMCGDKVILIDGDKHRSSLRSLAPQPGSIGVLEILQDKSRLPRALKRDPGGLHMLLQSDSEFQDTDLIGSSRMQTLLNVLRSNYRFVIIDSPPVLAVTDACSLAVAADRTVLVVKWGKTQRGAVRAATQRLQQANVQFAGAVLVQVDFAARAQLGDSSPYYYHSLVRDYYGG